MLTIGVLALQGGVKEHLQMLQQLPGIEAKSIKKPEELNAIQGLIIPGGESTTIGELMNDFGLKEPVKRCAQAGLPIWGTCAGLILLAKKIVNQAESHLDLLDISVRRNGYGSQLDSFIAYQVFPKISPNKIPLVFIRAPYVEAVGRGVEVLGELDGKIIAVEQENLLATSFHPELTKDLTFHRYFIKKVKNYIQHQKSVNS
ncbi:pyridoxal 5'-phosphate synthase glutaminase subunit PdxT [Zhaonella formicivorans]|uniref:pyridoxal 5'-phosphate synthase glutaminase subunit PdxT n=1 Tax=Zhaonella formicivorans TaxID=2528593 RepID=UPI0010F276F2|nr:pyridoxal 5'-phosphate synthase glutaminase subunit PdxT [Zhaonella formicivorans]